VTTLIKFSSELVSTLVTNIFYFTTSFFYAYRQNKGEKVEKPRTTGGDADKSDESLNPEVMSYAEIQVITGNIIHAGFLE
jgi:hypothetical protein